MSQAVLKPASFPFPSSNTLVRSLLSFHQFDAARARKIQPHTEAEGEHEHRALLRCSARSAYLCLVRPRSVMYGCGTLSVILRQLRACRTRDDS